MSMDELSVEYRMVPNSPNYRVGNDGSVWSRNKNTRGTADVSGWHLLVGGKDKDGYKKVILCNNGKRRYCRVNVLVLTTFIGPPPAGLDNPTAAHCNGIKDDNRLSNLRWASQADNISDKVKHGTAQVGEKHPQSIMTEQEVLEMRRLRRSGWSLRMIANKFGRKTVTVDAAVSGRNWKHLPGAVARFSVPRHF